MAYETVIVEKKDHITTITMNRPDTLNALNRTIVRELHAALDDVSTDDDTWVVILTGMGRGFSSGADVSGAPQSDDVPERPVTELGWHLRQVPQPVIAAVNGVAAGAGFSITIASEVRIASEQARFSSIFVKRSLVPDTGASYFMPRQVGPGIAAEMALTGKVYDAQWALEHGLVNRVVPADKLMEEAIGLAKEMMANPPLALREVKKALYAGDTPLPEILKWEGVGNGATSETEDRAESYASFREKRPPVFHGR